MAYIRRKMGKQEGESVPSEPAGIIRSMQVWADIVSIG